MKCPETVKRVNANFLIRYKFIGQPESYLIGGGKLEQLIDVQRAYYYFKKVLEQGKERYQYSYKNTITITFISR